MGFVNSIHDTKTGCDSVIAGAMDVIICYDSADTVNKVAIGPLGFSLDENKVYKIKFINGNTATNPTLNINGTGTKTIFGVGHLGSNSIIEIYVYKDNNNNYFYQRLYNDLYVDSNDRYSFDKKIISNNYIYSCCGFISCCGFLSLNWSRQPSGFYDQTRFIHNSPFRYLCIQENFAKNCMAWEMWRLAPIENISPSQVMISKVNVFVGGYSSDVDYSYPSIDTLMLSCCECKCFKLMNIGTSTTIFEGNLDSEGCFDNKKFIIQAPIFE